MFPRLQTSLLIVGLLASAALADVITLKDGRQFEGTIVAETAQTISIDAMVSNIRATLTLDKTNIASHQEKPLPQGFYDPPPAAQRLSDPRSLADPGSLYLEVPIKGRFGVEVRSSGVRAVIAYARAHRIGHLVFIVDSTGGDLDEAQEIYQLLKAQFGEIRMHAIVYNCLGDALAVPAACDTVNLLPGAKIGGLGEPLAEISDDLDREDEQIFRRQIANELEEAAQRRGRSGQIIRAMVAPSERLAAWKNEEGEVEMGSIPPPDIAKDRIIFTDGPDSVLMLNYEQAVALGLPPFRGATEDLGKLLEISQWQRESDFGQRAMTQAAANAARREEGVQSVFDAKVKENVARRTVVQRAIEHNLRQAAEWAPTEESYETYDAYATRWNWGWGRGYWETNRLTEESRQKWRDHTEASMHYLLEARSAMQTMQRLDKKARDLGLTPNYKPGELDLMMEDLALKIVYLNEHRIRTTK